jgi:hypothetical protein
MSENEKLIDAARDLVKAIDGHGKPPIEIIDELFALRAALPAEPEPEDCWRVIYPSGAKTHWHTAEDAERIAATIPGSRVVHLVEKREREWERWTVTGVHSIFCNGNFVATGNLDARQAQAIAEAHNKAMEELA